MFEFDTVRAMTLFVSGSCNLTFLRKKSVDFSHRMNCGKLLLYIDVQP